MANKTKSKPPHPLDAFHWEPQPKAQALIDEIVRGFMTRFAGAANVAHRMKHETGTRFKDWIDYIQLPRTGELKDRLVAVGFERTPVEGAPDCYSNPLGMFPKVILGRGGPNAIGIKVDSVVDFLSAWHIADDPTRATDDIEGGPLASMRRACAFRHHADELWVIERHGNPGFDTDDPPPAKAMLILKHLESFRRRARDWDEDEVGLDHTRQLVEAAVDDLGADRACDLFFQAEREYWQRRNRAAQVQKSRQDRLGLGWANHDHHTFRSSRHCFSGLIRILETLGFQMRERFYAGAEAGWGAQVVEQPSAGITIFADVDMSAEELMGDFAHEPMPARDELGTVGLWCALHGEAILQAGMHHLECQFDYEALVDQLEAAHVRTMDPFTNFPFLRQAFTEGERWTVAEKRLQKLLAGKHVTAAQAVQFRMHGAVGSHLENLERNDGYKGFNQHGVSDIIARTDPRKLAKKSEELIGA